jgi:hypothetical protein
MPPPVAVRAQTVLRTLEPEAVTRHRSYGGRHRASLPAGDHRWGITSLVRQCLSAGLRGARRRPLGGPYRRRGPWPRRPPVMVVWQRLAWPPPPGGGGADAGRAGPGRREVGEQVGEFTLPQGLVLLQAYPLGLHDRRRLIEQADCPRGVGRHVTYPLPRMLRPRPSR